MAGSRVTKQRPGRRLPRQSWCAEAARALGASAVVLSLALALALVAFLPPSSRTPPAAPLTLAELRITLARSGMDLPALRTGATAVPRLTIPRLPDDWRADTRADRRKYAFIAVVLPLVLRANESILADRRRLLHAIDRLRVGRALSTAEGSWVRTLASQYEVKPGSLNLAKGGFARLVERVDAVPPSLAIAQAAMESGWGSSRFAIEGNALFGEWVEESEEDAMVPAGREAGRTYAIRRFETLLESVEAYMRNLNTHRAYRQFRRARADARTKGATLAGADLALLLRSYSAQGPKYIEAIQTIIAKNSLDAFDRVELAERVPDPAG